MDEWNAKFKGANKKEVKKFYKNMKKLVSVKKNKQAYSQNLMNLLHVYSKFNNKALSPNLSTNMLNGHFTLRDYQDIFGDFRKTLMGGRTSKQKTTNLFNLGQKTNALKRYMFEYENLGEGDNFNLWKGTGTLLKEENKGSMLGYDKNNEAKRKKMDVDKMWSDRFHSEGAKFFQIQNNKALGGTSSMTRGTKAMLASRGDGSVRTGGTR